MVQCVFMVTTDQLTTRQWRIQASSEE